MNSKARQIFVTNLKREMRRTGKTQSDISRALNIPLSTVSSWHSGASYPRVDKMQALADYFRVSMRDLTDDMSASDHPVLRIPLYDMISCGTGGFVDDQIIDYVVLPAEMFSPSKEYFAQYAHGDSMINAGIHDGDLVIFQKRLGHSSIEQTLKTYTHLLESTDSEMMKIINSEKNGSTMVPR